MRLTDHVTLNFNNIISTAPVFLDIEEPLIAHGTQACCISWNSRTVFTKLIRSFLAQRKFRVSVEGEITTPRKMQARVPQGSVLSLTLSNLYINDAPQHMVFTCPSLRTTPVYMRQIARSVLLSEHSTAVTAEWRTGVSAGILKLVMIRLKGCTALVVVDLPSLVLL
jgi:hypothetical protein